MKFFLRIQVKLLLAYFVTSFSISGQSLHDPQQNYEPTGGLFDEDSLRQFSLTFYRNDYHQYLKNSWYYAPSERIPAQLELNGVIYDSVGVRYKGNSTFCLPNDIGSRKVPYNIDMNHYIGGAKVLGAKKIKLANAWVDPTLMKQIIASNQYRKYLPTGESNLIKLYAQGNYVGLYVNDESINKQFLEKHFGEKDGPLFKCDNITRYCDTANAPSAMPPNLYYMGMNPSAYYDSYDMKSDEGWDELVELIRTIEFDFDNLQSILNVDRVLWAFAANQVLLNLDCYNTYYIHNFYLYQTEDGLFQMIPWDLDNSFTGGIMGWNYWSPANVYEFEPYILGPPLGGSTPAWEQRPLLNKILENGFYRNLYSAHLRTIINELDTAAIRTNIEDLQDLAYPAVVQDVNKPFSNAQFYENAENAIWTNWGFGGIMSTLHERLLYLSSHPEINRTAPIIDSVRYLFNNDEVVVTSAVSGSNSVELLVSNNGYASKFESFLMNDNGVNGDETAGDGIYSLNLPFQDSAKEISFYLRAFNTEACALMPERAEYEFYTYLPDAGSEDDMAFSLYPNPTRGLFTISLSSLDQFAVTIHNGMGATVYAGETTGLKTDVDLTSFASGVYIVQLQNESTRLARKLIVQ